MREYSGWERELFDRVPLSRYTNGGFARGDFASARVALESEEVPWEAPRESPREAPRVYAGMRRSLDDVDENSADWRSWRQS